MTSLFLVLNHRVLLQYRRGSRAIADSWVGLGGHVEPGELEVHCGRHDDLLYAGS